MFVSAAQYVNKCLVWHKKFEPAQNILGHVKGQGISLLKIDMCPNVVPCVVHTDHKAPLLILWKNLCGSAPTAAAA